MTLEILTSELLRGDAPRLLHPARRRLVGGLCRAELRAGLVGPARGGGDEPGAGRRGARGRAGAAAVARTRCTRRRWSVAGPEGWTERPRADAAVTDVPGLALGVLTADCAPVLFADAEAGVVGAAHAGWRGALDGVLEATLAAMERLGARRGASRAAVGPTISQRAYEVGPEFFERFRDEDAGYERFFAPGARRPAALRPAGLRAGAAARSRGRRGGLDRRLHLLGAGSVLLVTGGRRTRARPDYGRLISAIRL